MKNIREIITDLNVARSNSCSQEKSEEIKKIINDLLPHEKKEKALEIIVSKVQLGGFIDSLQQTKNYEEYKNTYITSLSQEEYDLLKEVLNYGK